MENKLRSDYLKFVVRRLAFHMHVSNLFCSRRNLTMCIFRSSGENLKNIREK